MSKASKIFLYGFLAIVFCFGILSLISNSALSQEYNCSGKDVACKTNLDCCSTICKSDNQCACSPDGWFALKASDCCSGKSGANNICSPTGDAPTTCLPINGSCGTDNTKCCSNLCQSGKCACLAKGGVCSSSGDCCNGSCKDIDSKTGKGICFCQENKLPCKAHGDCCSKFCGAGNVCVQSSSDDDIVVDAECVNSSDGAITIKTGACCSREKEKRIIGYGSCDSQGYCVLDSNLSPFCAACASDGKINTKSNLVCYDGFNSADLTYEKIGICQNGQCDVRHDTDCVSACAVNTVNNKLSCSFMPNEYFCIKFGINGQCDGNGTCLIPGGDDDGDDDGDGDDDRSEPRCQESQVKCSTGGPDNRSWMEKCVYGNWEFQNYCAAACNASGTACEKGSENCCNNIDDDLDNLKDAQDSDCNQAQGTINLQAGANNVCWQAKPWGMIGGSESQYDYTSPTFSCPTGYWVKLTGNYLIRDFEELYLIYSGGQTLPYGYGTGTQMPSGTGSLNSIFRASQLSLRYNSGGGKQEPFTNLALQQFGVLVSSVECVAEAASNDCGSCGDNGIFDGLLNPCDMDECYEIGGGPFYTGEGQCFYQPNTLGGQCYNKSPVDFLVRDAISQTPLAGVKVNIYSYDYLNCTTGSDGKCQIDLALGASFTAFVTGDNLDCQTPNCRKYFTPTLIPEEVVLEPYKIIACSDSDAGSQFPNGAKNYYQKGTASETYGSFTDVCNSEQALKEYSCAINNRAVFEDYACSLGCLEGRCLTPENQNLAKVTFKVTSGGDSVAGVIVASQGGIGYSCLTGNNGECSIELARDSYTAFVNDPLYLCQDPGCPKTFEAIGLDNFVEIVLQRKTIAGTPYCHDTDGGQNYEEAGVVKVDKGSMFPIQTFLDYCFADGKTLEEGFCDQNFLGVATNVCAYGCANGACEQGGGQDEQATLIFGVYDEAAKEPIPGATVISNPGLKSCSTLDNGSCEIDVDPEPNAKYTINVYAPGFEPAEPFFANPSEAIEYPFTTYLKKRTSPEEETLLKYKYKVLGLLGVPLEGAKGETILPNDIVASTCLADAQGVCLLEMEIGKTYNLKFSKTGFEDTLMSYSPVAADKDRLVNGIVEPEIIVPLVNNQGPPASDCSSCGDGIFNPCDAAECNALNGCVFANNHCLNQDYWAALQAIKNRVEALEDRIDEARKLVAASDLAEEKKQNLEKRLDAVENELEAIRDLLPDYLFSFWRNLRSPFVNNALAAADIDFPGMSTMLGNLEDEVDDIIDVIPGLTGYSSPIHLTQAEELIKNLTRWFISLLGSIALVMLIFSGFRYLTAGADENRATNAKKMITWTIIGLAIILGAAAIVNGLIAALS